MKRLFGAIVDGLGHKAGEELFDALVDEAVAPSPTSTGETSSESSEVVAPSAWKRWMDRRRVKQAARDADRAIDRELARLRERIRKSL